MSFTQHPLNINHTSVADKVLALRKYWIKRDPEHPFYTLGRCAYLDGKTPAYAAEIQTTLGLGDVDPLTFTVAIELPCGGGGLDYIENEKPQHLSYTEGQIVVHDGSVVHRIAPFKECIMGDYRITLQGHLIRHNGVMTMFW